MPTEFAVALPVVSAHAVGSPEFYWAIVAESSILLFTVLLLLGPRWTPQPDLPRFRLVAFAAALLASLVTLIGKALEVWPGHPLFPSGHTAYGVSVAISLVTLDRRWTRVVVPLLALLAVALVLAAYHIPLDIVGGAGVGVVVSAAVWRGRRAWVRRSGRAPVTG